jgi:hypothetical protein
MVPIICNPTKIRHGHRCERAKLQGATASLRGPTTLYSFDPSPPWRGELHRKKSRDSSPVQQPRLFHSLQSSQPDVDGQLDPSPLERFYPTRAGTHLTAEWTEAISNKRLAQGRYGGSDFVRNSFFNVFFSLLFCV